VAAVAISCRSRSVVMSGRGMLGGAENVRYHLSTSARIVQQRAVHSSPSPGAGGGLFVEADSPNPKTPIGLATAADEFKQFRGAASATS
jgi:hypothetical protein